MPSGKKSKEARRAAAAPPPVVSKGGVRRRQADPRVLWGAGGVIVLVVVAIVLAVVFTGGNGSSSSSNVPAVGSLDNALPGAAEVNDDLKGIPQQGMTLGSAKAPVTLTEYVDLQCPICREFESVVMPDVIQKYVKTGKVRVDTRVLKFIGPDSEKARKAMLAAAKQNKAYNFALVLYANQGTENTGWLTDDFLNQIAASVPGLRVQELRSEMNSSSVAKQGTEMDKQGETDKVPGTPTLYVGKTGTKGTVVAIANADDEATLTKAIDDALNS
jgi:protein-disulfide isomerase